MSAVSHPAGLFVRNPAMVPIDFSQMEQVPHPNAVQNSMAVSVTASGHIALNQKLYQAVEQALPSLEVDFRVSSDRTLLSIRPSDAPNYKFPKGGRIKDAAFSRCLVAAGIPLPARYVAAWNEAAGAWVGVLADSPQPSREKALSKSLKAAEKGGRAGR